MTEESLPTWREFLEQAEPIKQAFTELLASFGIKNGVQMIVREGEVGIFLDAKEF